NKAPRAENRPVPLVVRVAAHDGAQEACEVVLAGSGGRIDDHRPVNQFRAGVLARQVIKHLLGDIRDGHGGRQVHSSPAKPQLNPACPPGGPLRAQSHPEFPALPPRRSAANPSNVSVPCSTMSGQYRYCSRARLKAWARVRGGRLTFISTTS